MPSAAAPSAAAPTALETTPVMNVVMSLCTVSESSPVEAVMSLRASAETAESALAKALALITASARCWRILRRRSTSAASRLTAPAVSEGALGVTAVESAGTENGPGTGAGVAAGATAVRLGGGEGGSRGEGGGGGLGAPPRSPARVPLKSTGAALSDAERRYTPAATELASPFLPGASTALASRNMIKSPSCVAVPANAVIATGMCATAAAPNASLTRTADSAAAAGSVVSMT
mmetsp:Transcript_2902/g.4619  ORF Transcript_2902/g.4619 Transcript_2902/m.4619 type:complete len:234 (-) Transcript_2902:2840-3541(-)